MAPSPTDYQHFSVGPAFIWYSALGIGITRDGVDISLQPRYADIQSDDYGGQGGVPSDSQLLGATAQVRIELVKFNRARLEQLTAFSSAGLASGAPDISGLVPEIGAFVRQDGLGDVLDIRGTRRSYIFPCAFLRGNLDFNAGVRNQTVMLGFEAWIDDPAEARRLMQITDPPTQA